MNYPTPGVGAASFGVSGEGPLSAGEVHTSGFTVSGVFETPYRDGGEVVIHRVIKMAGPSGTAHV